MIPHFAQVTAVPDHVLKYAVIIALSALGAVGVAVGIWSAFQRKSVSIEPQPVVVKKQAAEYNPEFCLTKHSEITRRLDAHDSEIEQIWNTFRAEDAAIRRDMQKSFEQIMRSLGRIEGRLGKSHSDEV